MTFLLTDRDEGFSGEIYYRRPDTWRIQGRETVQFVAGDRMRVFDIKTLRFAEDQSEVRGRIIEPEDLEPLCRGDVLRGLLQVFFCEGIPVGKPVMSTSNVVTPDVALFDYAHDPKRLWLRVWVLRESRLPIRAEGYFPQGDKHVLAMFNYSDPQPDEFFDPDRFDHEVKTKGLKKAYRIYRVGMRPIGEKPRSAAHIHELQGYKAPELLEIVANRGGDLMILSTDP